MNQYTTQQWSDQTFFISDWMIRIQCVTLREDIPRSIISLELLPCVIQLETLCRLASILLIAWYYLFQLL